MIFMAKNGENEESVWKLVFLYKDATLPSFESL